MSEAIEQLLITSAVSLFAAFDVRVARQPGGATRGRFAESTATAALVSLTGKDLRGAVLLVSTFDFVASCLPEHGHPAPLSSSSAGDWLYVRDWTKELANQLVGRIKNRLAPHGVDLGAGIPVALTGRAVAAEIAARGTSPLGFSAGIHEFAIWWDAPSPNIDLGVSPARQTDNASEGAILLF